MEPKPRGIHLEEVNARGGSAHSHRVIPACVVRIPQMREPS